MSSTVERGLGNYMVQHALWFYIIRQLMFVMVRHLMNISCGLFDCHMTTG